MPESVDRRLAKLEERLALQEQRMQALLSRKGGYVDGLVRLSGDLHPNLDGRGLAARWINPIGVTNWTAHFRTGETTGPGNGTLASYAWAGAPMAGVPAVISYSSSGDFMIGRGDGAGQKHFLYRSIPNAAASWQGKDIYILCTTGHTTDVGVRIDDGSGNNRAELYLDGQTDGTYDVVFAWSDAGGSGSATAGWIGRLYEPVLLRLYSFWDGSQYHAYGYFVSQQGASGNINGFSRTLTGNWTSGPPVTGRAGVFLAEYGNQAEVDWFWNNLI